jgi:hypothetical protein
MAGSNTVPKQLTPFVKGDPRINRNGRPKSFDALRTLAQQIAHETAKAGGADVVIDGHKVTVTEAVLRQWFQSKDFQKQRAAMEIAFGKVPTPVDLRGKDGGAIEVHNTQTIDLSGLTIDERQSLVTLIAKLESPEA